MWKCKKQYICKTPGLSLHIGLAKIEYKYIELNPKFSKEDYKKVVNCFPLTISDCRCKDCRYARLIKKDKRNNNVT